MLSPSMLRWAEYGLGAAIAELGFDNPLSCNQSPVTAGMTPLTVQAECRATAAHCLLHLYDPSLVCDKRTAHIACSGDMSLLLSVCYSVCRLLLVSCSVT